jgi:hypothetical protein
VQPFVLANQFIAEAEAWHQTTFLEPEDGAKRPQKEDAFYDGECNFAFGKAGSGSVTPLESPLLETYRNPLFLVRGDSRESSERPTSLCVVCCCNHYPLVGGVPARLIL